MPPLSNFTSAKTYYLKRSNLTWEAPNEFKPVEWQNERQNLTLKASSCTGYAYTRKAINTYSPNPERCIESDYIPGEQEEDEWL